MRIRKLAREVEEITYFFFVPTSYYRAPRMIEEAGIGQLQTTFDRFLAYGLVTAFELARLGIYYSVAKNMNLV